jgi:hypothetical protein
MAPGASSITPFGVARPAIGLDRASAPHGRFDPRGCAYVIDQSTLRSPICDAGSQTDLARAIMSETN